LRDEKNRHETEIARLVEAIATGKGGPSFDEAIAESGSYLRINSSLVAGLNYTDSTVRNATTYYYVTTAVDNTGIESVYSNQVSAVIP
jgi:hypothetical protein